MTEKRHNVFISYHHNDEDVLYQQVLSNILLDINAEKAITSRRDEGFADIPPKTDMKRVKHLIRERFLGDTTVTIVLIGQDTWKRKHIDWEISSSITDEESHVRSGLIGIVLPSHCDYEKERVSQFHIPPRLHDNIKCHYAKLYKWNDDPQQIQEWIHEAFLRRYKKHPDDSRALYKTNRMGLSWRP